MVRWIVGSILHRVNPLSYFSFQPVPHDWCNKGCGMCYHMKEPLLLIDKSSLCGGSGFPFSLSEWSLTICLTPYNRRYNVCEREREDYIDKHKKNTLLSTKTIKDRIPSSSNVTFNTSVRSLLTFIAIIFIFHLKL